LTATTAIDTQSIRKRRYCTLEGNRELEPCTVMMLKTDLV